METEKRIVIADADCLSKEELKDLEDYLTSRSIDYEEQDIVFNQEGNKK